MSYTDLKIDRRKIVPSIYEKCVIEQYENYVIGSLENKDGKRYRLQIEVNGNHFFLDFFFKQNYKTTIQTGQGNNKELQEEFAKHLYEDTNLYSENYIAINKEYEQQLGINKRANDTIVYKNLDDNIIEKLLIVIREEKCCKKIEIVRREEKVSIYKIYDISNNEITLTNFSAINGYTIMVQGKPKVLFAICAADIAELIGREENIEALNEFYGTHTTLEEIEREYEEMFTNAKSYINEKLKKCICQALQNRRDLGEKFDSTYLAAPAERALEGHIRYALIDVLNTDKLNVFEPVYENGENKRYQLQEAHWKSLGNNRHKIDCIGRAYTYMKFVRNKLSHWDKPNGLHDTTKQLSSKEVDKTIMEALKLIEEYYS